MLTEEELLELLTFLVTAARNMLDEPANYGPMRLLDAAERLSYFAEGRVSAETGALLRQILEESPRVQSDLNQRERYQAGLDGLCTAVARHLVAQSSLGGAA
jgi:hypothetical protein